MDNRLQQKLSAVEATPPEGLWQRIAVALDDSAPSFADQLQDYREAPDDAVWKRIENELDDALPAKLIPLHTRYKIPIRYASAAAIIGAILIIGTLAIKRTEAGSLNSIQQSNVLAAPSTKKSDNQRLDATAATTEWVIYTDSRGDTMRMQKRLFDLLQCRNGDDACRRRIAKLRKKLSSANATSDFTGLLEMVRRIK